jgi:hypothetical protein
VHVGLLSATSVNRKAGVTPRIGPVTGLDKTPGRFSATKRLAYDWTDGTPTAAALTHAGLYVAGAGEGFRVMVPADPGSRTVVLYLGGYQASGRLEASLNDGSASPYEVTLSDLSGAFDRRVAISYRAATPGSTLILRYTMTAGTGNVTFQAVTLGNQTAGGFAPDAAPAARAGAGGVIRPPGKRTSVFAVAWRSPSALAANSYVSPLAFDPDIHLEKAVDIRCYAVGPSGPATRWASAP